MSKYLNDFKSFIKSSPTAFQAVSNIKKRLEEKGFKNYIDTSITYGSKFYITKGETSVIAVSIPEKKTYKHSLNIVASHTDSPGFKLKPNNIIENKGYTTLNTEVYGGPIFSTFFDRPLSIAGRVFLKTKEGIKQKLINYDKPLLVIPNLPIHLNREVNKGVAYNAQIDMSPVFSLEENKDIISFIKKQEKIKEEIVSHDLYLYPIFTPIEIGENNDMLLSQRIDNLESAYCSLISFLSSNNESSINIYVSFDNEEIGSKTNQGAGSTFLKDVLDLIFQELKLNKIDKINSFENSMIISCDNAHAIHPNRKEKYDPTNQVSMNKGIVIKHNAQGAYTTDGLTSAIFKSICDNNNIPYQDFVNRSDERGGSTLGAISLGNVSIKSIDIGLAQLAMHSAVETCGIKDIDYLIEGLKAYYNATLLTQKDIIIK